MGFIRHNQLIGITKMCMKRNLRVVLLLIKSLLQLSVIDRNNCLKHLPRTLGILCVACLSFSLCCTSSQLEN